MNVDKLLKVLSKYAGTEVTLGVKRGAKAAKERPPIPIGDVALKIALFIHDVNNLGRPDIQRTYNAATQSMETEIFGHYEANCGLRVDAYQATGDYAAAWLADFRLAMQMPEFREELRAAGFGLLVVGPCVKINYQADEAAAMDFSLSFEGYKKGLVGGGWFNRVTGGGTIHGGVDGDISDTFDSDE